MLLFALLIFSPDVLVIGYDLEEFAKGWLNDESLH